jgi:acyl carrier protein
LPLSFSQERLLSIARGTGKSATYHIHSIVHLQGKLKVEALSKSFQEIIARHEILRTTFVLVEGEAIQKIANKVNFQLRAIDLRDVEKKHQPKAIQTKIDRLLEQPFDLAADLPWRFELIQIEDKEYLLIRVMHHIISDAWSGNIFWRELCTFYNLFCIDKSPELPQLKIQYADYAAWQRQQLQQDKWQTAIAYWQEKLAGEILPLQLPLDRPRSHQISDRGGKEILTLSQSCTQGLKELSQQEGVSLFVTLLTAFKALLFYYSQQTDLIIAYPVANRDRLEIKKLIGYFNNILLLRTHWSKQITFRQLLHLVSQNTLEAQPHQHLPFQTVAELPNLVKVPLNRAMFALQNTLFQSPPLNNIQVKTWQQPTQKADFELFMSLQETHNEIVVNLIYKSDLFDKTTIAQMLKNFEFLIETALIDRDLPLQYLPLDTYNQQISTLLQQHPQVEEALVLSYQDILIAYIVPEQTQVPTPETLKEFLKTNLPNFRLPYSFIPIEALPRNESGDIAPSLLPNYQLNNFKTPFVPPRNAIACSAAKQIEQKLAAIWQKVLWLDREIGNEENFFDLGGNSLLSARLVAEIETAFALELPKSVILKLNTIADVAEFLQQDLPKEILPQELEPKIYRQLLAYTAAWQGKRVREDSLLVGLNTAGTKPPLFWCLQGFRELSQLAKYLDRDRPIYGMRSGHLIMEYSPENIQALANYYVEEILSVQTEGDYYIGGNCQAARIAQTMAIILQNQGRKVKLLCLLEDRFSQFYRGAITLLYGRDSIYNPYKHSLTPEIGWRKLYPEGFFIDLISGQHGQFFQEPNIQNLAKQIELAIAMATI